jgi:hypothetical protein
MTATIADQGWEPPVPLTCPALPSFPVSMLPFKLDRFVTALAASTETSPDLAGSLVLAAVAAAVARKAVVRPKADYEEPLNLMCLVALPPGERKSAVFGRVFGPMARHEARLRELARPEVERIREERKAIQQEIVDYERRSRRGDDPDVEQRLQEARDALSALPARALPRFLADDATPEAIPHLLVENNGRLCIASAEGGIISTLRGRYAAGVVNIDVLLKGHSGETLRIDRRNADAIIVERTALSVALAVQPAVLSELMSQREFRGRGLVARFLFALPTPRVGTRTFDGPPLPDPIGREYDETIERLLEFETASEPHVVRLSRVALEHWLHFAREVEAGCGEHGELVTLRDWVAKLPGAVIRLAGLLHICDRAWQTRDLAEPVTETTMARAIDLGRYYLAHARAVLGADVRDDGRANAEALLDWVSRRRVFTVRLLQRSLKSRFPTADDAPAAIEVLVEHGYVRARQPPMPIRGRPPNEVFDVHPMLGADETLKSARSDGSS